MKRALLVILLAGCGSAELTDSAPEFGATRQAEETWPVLPQWQALIIEAHEEMRDKGSSDEWTDVETWVYGLVETTAQGVSPKLSFHPCRVLLPEVAGITPSLEDAAVQAVPNSIVDANWSKTEDGFYRLTTPGWTGMVFGARLANPLTDALPTNKNDSRVYDVDGDGKTGITMKASIGRLYMVLRGLMQLDGFYDAETKVISGNAQYTRDFYIFGDNVFGIAKSKVNDAMESSEFRPARTVGALSPLDVAAPTCADVLPK